jgi:hypothetical protein
MPLNMYLLYDSTLASYLFPHHNQFQSECLTITNSPFPEGAYPTKWINGVPSRTENAPWRTDDRVLQPM